MRMIGDVIGGRYELEELVGSGGMSTVFRAHDKQLERTVALKLLHERHVDDDESVERFRREARAAAALSHPNIVTVIDRGDHEGRPFIVFEYVGGENLKERIERSGPPPIPEALELCIQVAHALAYAHEQGLVHRDVKPQNVLLNGEDVAKVSDFGIARSLDVRRGLTQTGTVIGTSEYIAPEQAQGAVVDERTDVYSFGVLLYELLTGEVPFHGESFVEVALRHLNEEPPSVLERRPDTPPRLALAVERALAKRPGDRFPSMAAFCSELEACLDEPAEGQTVVLPPTRAARRGRSPVWPVAAFALGAVALAGTLFGLLEFGRDRISIGSENSTPPPARPVPLTGIGAYDPYGNGGEHDADAGEATDRNPQTYWRTQGYEATFATLRKPGVGVVLDAGRSVRVSRLKVRTDTPGFTAQILAGDNSQGHFRPASKSHSVGSTTTFVLNGSSARYYVVWITELPSGLRAHVNEVTATSPSQRS